MATEQNSLLKNSLVEANDTIYNMGIMYLKIKNKKNGYSIKPLTNE